MKLTIFAALFSSTLMAQINSVELKNFNFNYVAPTGEGTADVFSYSQRDRSAQNVYVEKVGEEFKVKLTGVEEKEFVFKDAPSLVMDAQTMIIQNFNLQLNTVFKLSMTSGKFVSPDDKIDLRSFSLSCNRMTSHTDILDQLIAGCVQKLTLTSSQFTTEEEKFSTALVKAIDPSFDERGGTTIKNINFKATSGKFELQADIKAQISGTATGKGSLAYDAATDVLTVKVSEVKFGFLDVTSQVFDELKKNESDNFKVKQPYLYLTVK